MKNRKFLISLISVFLFIMLIGGVSYSYFIYNKDVANVSLETGDIAINYNNVTNNVNNLNLMPQNDNIGKLQNQYIDFTITGIVDTDAILYELEIIPKSDNTINTNFIKLYLTDQNDNFISGPFLYTELYNAIFTGRKAIYQKLVEPNNNGSSTTFSHDYRLRMWVDDDYNELESKNFSFGLYLYSLNTDAANLDKVVYYTQDDRESLIKYREKNSVDTNTPNFVRDGYNFTGWIELANTYEPVKYIKSTGNQYIDTNVPGNNDNLSFKIKYSWVEIQDNVYQTVFGSYVDDDTNTTRLLQSGTDTTRVGVNVKYRGGVISYIGERSVGTIYEEIIAQNSYTTNGVTITKDTTTKGNENTEDIFVFSRNGPSIFSKIKLYYFKIYDNNSLIRNYIPVKNKTSNKFGLLDTVNNIFYTSPNNNQFVVDDDAYNTNSDGIIYLANWE